VPAADAREAGLGHGERIHPRGRPRVRARGAGDVHRHVVEGAAQGRIFIDYLRNYRGATSVAPYTVRARAGVPVSVPIAWEELAKLESSQVYTIKNLEQRLKKLKRDPWAELPGTRQFLRKTVLQAVAARKLAA
jgi:DNA primase